MPMQHNSPTPTGQMAARRQWLQQQQQVLQAAWLRVKKSQGMTAIHEVRVAARRLRTVLKGWRKEIHPLRYAELRFALRDVGRLLAPTREADVRRRLTARMLRAVPEELVDSANQLLADLDQTRAVERKALRDHMHSDRCQESMARIQACIDNDQLLAVPRGSANFESERLRFDNDLRKLLKACAKKRGLATQLHALRIRGKHIRYVGEALAELSGENLAAQLKSLRLLQDWLGDLHDCLQLREWCHANHLDPALMAWLEACLTRWQRQQQVRFDDFRARA